MSNSPNSRNSAGQFVKGSSGNPNGGRPVNPIKQFMKEDVTAARAFLKSVIDDPDAKTSDRIECAKVLLDRHLGKARQDVDLQLIELNPEERLERLFQIISETEAEKKPEELN